MPKIPVKRKNTKQPGPPRIPIKFVSQELETIKSDLLDAYKRLDHLWVSLYTVGLAERGPITEGKDDIPF